MENIPKTNYEMPEVPEYLSELPDRISEHMNGRTVLISGGTGFLGKVLIEKILRKSPNVERLYLILRTKKGKDPRQRLEELINNPIFDVLKKKRGVEIFDKVTVIGGDVGEVGLGISEEDRKLICKTVQIVFHGAATVRFDEPLRKAILLNTRGTKQMLELAKDMPNLLLFSHISTSYCHLQEKVLEEKAYPVAADPHKIIKCCELLEEDVIEGVGKKLMKDFPNSYAFTKNLSEGLVIEQINNGMPCMILRPSIVIPVWLEPLPGWTDNINGPTGLLIGAGKGVIRSMYCDNTGYADYLPVDITVNGILIAAWNYICNKDTKRIVFHLTSSSEWQITWQEIIDTGRDIVTKEIPLNGGMWYPGGSMKRSRLLHQICVLFFHMIPAYFLDVIIFLSGNKPVLVKVQDRINKGFDVFEYYANNQWIFKNDSLINMRSVMNSREAIEYKIDGIGMEIRKYFSDCILAARLYVLKETPDTIPAARRHMRMLYWLDTISKTLLLGLFVWFVYAWSGTMVNLVLSVFQMIEHLTTFFKSEELIKPIRHDL